MSTSIGIKFKDLLLAESGVTDIIEDRIYPVSFPAKATFPLMVYREVAGAHDLRTAPKDATVEMTTRLQFDFWSYEYDETRDMKSVLVSFFDGYQNPSQGILTTKIDLAFDQQEPETTLLRLVINISTTHEGP